MQKRNEILRLLQNQCRLAPADIAQMMNIGEDEVNAIIRDLEEEQVIMGYGALIDWTKTEDDFVTAMIEVRVTPQRDRGFGRIAQRIYQYPEVSNCYLVSGDYDLMVIVVAKNLQAVAAFVSDKIAPVDGVLSTRTHFILKNYKVNGVVFENDSEDARERIVL
jgi:DNA-binding Lrp family transcriptional regulator